MIRKSHIAAAAALCMTLMGTIASAQVFTGKGPVGDWTKRGWNAARFGAYSACVASGCHSCSMNQTAADSTSDAACHFNNGYTCISTCHDKPVCSAPPAVTASVTPTKIWPPNHKMVAVTISGTVTQGAGCTLSGASYALTDEYGANQAGPLTVGTNGSFSTTIYVEAWRLGTDLDGRSYSFTASAKNEAGTGVSNAAVSTVPHDQRN